MGVDDYALVYDQPLYDTIHLAAAAVGGTFFGVPIGGAIGAGIKTLAHTNLRQAGRLEQDHHFMIDGISLWFPEGTAAGAILTWADFQAVRSGSLELWIGDKPFLEVPCQAIPNAGFDTVLVSNIAAAVTEFHVANGVSAHANRFQLKYPLPLKAQQTVRVVLGNLQGAALAAATRVGCMLWGTHSRPAS